MIVQANPELIAKDIELTKEALTRLAREAMQIDPTRGYDSARRWKEIHDEISDEQDFLAALEAGTVKWQLVQSPLTGKSTLVPA